MTYETAKEKAAKWLAEIKERYNYKDIEPCDFILPDLTVLDLIMMADDVEMLSEMLLVHGHKCLNACLCESLSYIPFLDQNECYKTLRVAEAINIENCLKMKRELIDSVVAPLVEKMKKDTDEKQENET